MFPGGRTGRTWTDKSWTKAGHGRTWTDMDGHGHQLDKKIFFLKIILKAKILQKFNEQIILAKKKIFFF